MSEISKETFDKIVNIDAKIDLLYDKQICTDKKVDELNSKLTKHSFYNKACSTVGGIIGGIIAFVGMFVGKIFLS